jgi:5-oxoprolinase (ATP-hydrolysing)
MSARKSNKSKLVRFSIDRGGTFTDLYAEFGSNKFEFLKLLSEDPQNYSDAPIEGIKRILKKIGLLKESDKLSTDIIEWVRMGTTVATNALLERDGEKTALVVTAGFGDILQIGSQNRPDIFDLKIKKPSLLYNTVIEVGERIRPVLTNDEDETDQGLTGDFYKIIKRPDPQIVKGKLQQLLNQGITSIAVAFLHSYNYPDHEIIIGKIAKELGFKQISLSSEIMPMIKIVPRGDTAVIDAYLTPKIKEYLHGFQAGFSGPFSKNNLLFMQSDGGLSPADQFRGCNSILSGPAGGVVGYAMTAFSKKSKKPVIGFDMGGTSTDVSRYDGNLEVVHETETAGVRIQAPQLFINTVAAGGGSRLFFENLMFKVGPQSAGAHPGPICYRKNGYLSITDANLILGRLHPDYFPKIFGPDENLALDINSSRQAMAELTGEINSTYLNLNTPAMSIEEVSLGFLAVANQTMARAIQEISVMRGYNIRDHILATFGGAGGQHACAIAAILTIKEIFIHRYSGILSAYGMGLADVVIEKQMPAAKIYSKETKKGLFQELIKLADFCRKELFSQEFTSTQIKTENYLHLRYEDTSNNYMILEPEDGDFEAAFRAKHSREFGFDHKNRAILVDDIRVRAIGARDKVKRSKISQHIPNSDGSITSCFFSDGWHDTPVFLLESLGAGFQAIGPAMIISDISTIIVEPGCRVAITEFGDVKINVEEASLGSASSEVDPVQLSIFSNLFISIAEQMGRTLQRTSISTNIKERLDFSCAIFDDKGRLVANAPHIPVHLGAMSSAVIEQIRIQKDNLKQGDVLVSNHPAAGGSHLPDITVITPVWQNKKIIFYTASRGHHADIGGITPGSMPPFSKSLSDEGAAILSTKLVKEGIFQENEIKNILRDSRKISDNIADLKAQIAANKKGQELLDEITTRYSLNTVLSYMSHIQKCSEMAVRELLKKFVIKNGPKKNNTVFHASDKMDDGTIISLKITVEPKDGSALFDFSGTGPQVSANWNCPKSVVSSAVLYTLRCLLETDLPLNQGCLAPITIAIPEGSLLSPTPDAAVVGGNVLTSQRIVDVIFKAFNTCAASQGCMNNLTFGNSKFGYYETIGGGAGAGPDWHGQSGVHTHMTNTRSTDPEILENRFPVMLRQYSIRKKSGGKGRFKGGNGLIREIEALDNITAAILSERRVFSPYGLAGGESGKKGENIYVNINGKQINLGGKNEVELAPGEKIIIKTPGGGGFGE